LKQTWLLTRNPNRNRKWQNLRPPLLRQGAVTVPDVVVVEKVGVTGRALHRRNPNHSKRSRNSAISSPRPKT
jgi:hypothetical protein